MYIKVNHSEFETAASAIDSFVNDTMKKQMNNAEKEVDGLAASWQGRDYMQFKSQWSKVTGSDSSYTKMLKALESYSKFLRYAAKQYKEAQARAVNRANGLPRY